MRAWQDIEKKRRWAATPSSLPGEGSRAAGLIGTADMSWRDDGSRFESLSENPMDGRMDQFARGERWEDIEMEGYLETGHWDGY